MGQVTTPNNQHVQQGILELGINYNTSITSALQEPRKRVPRNISAVILDTFPSSMVRLRTVSRWSSTRRQKQTHTLL